MAGPFDVNNLRIMTQAFCSRTHYDIFGYFYPPAFKNWYSDDWATFVYGADNTFWCGDIQVSNTNVKGTRYGSVPRFSLSISLSLSVRPLR